MGKPFKILSIDGGGIKGLYSSTILEHLEEKYKCSISDHFDMLCGTSTGGLIALALSLKIPAKEISDIYINTGKHIFPSRWYNEWYRTIGQIFWGGKYNDKALKKAATELFKDRTIKESNNLLCIPSYLYTEGKTWVFKWDHPEGELERDNKALYRDVALATSAAPTYLPLAKIDYLDSKLFIDGGVWANNPSLVGLIEALHRFVGVDKEYTSIELLSISSLNNIKGKKPGIGRFRSFVRWKEDLFETTMIGQSSFTHFFLEKLGNLNNIPITYVRIPTEVVAPEQQSLIKLDKSTKKAITLIRSKGNDRGLISKKDERVAAFFKSLKTYKTN